MKSLAGEPCRICPNLPGIVRATVPLKSVGNGVYELALKKGEEAILYTGDKLPTCEIRPVAANPARCNYFGQDRK